MFNNLTKDILYYSLTPFIITAIIVLILMIIGKKKDNNYYKYDYSIKVLLFIIIAIVLPLIIGYTAWVYERFISRGLVSSNIGYMILLGVLIISLIILLIITFIKLSKNILKPSDDY